MSAAKTPDGARRLSLDEALVWVNAQVAALIVRKQRATRPVRLAQAIMAAEDKAAGMPPNDSEASTAALPAPAAITDRASVPGDLITLAVAASKYEVTHTTLKRAIGKAELRSYRPHGAPRNAKHKVSEAEVARLYPRKQVESDSPYHFGGARDQFRYTHRKALPCADHRPVETYATAHKAGDDWRR